jgi:anaerobic glycerol-3-phosphate dehydrogenase
MGAQPYASYGLRVDTAMRPATDDGAAYFTNLFAAGGVLAAGDRAMEGSRQGIDLVTAFRAVESALGVSLP